MITNNDIIRFKSKIIYPDDIENECWEFKSAIVGKNYKSFYYDGKLGYAHRFSYIIHNNIETITPGYYICHKCDNPGCVNYKHLFEGTPTDNNHDMVRKGRMNPAKGEQLPNSKLTDQDVIDIMEGKYLNIADVCQQLEVSRSIPEKILKGIIWKHITKDYDLDNIKQSMHITPKPISSDIAREIKIRLKNQEKVKDIANIYNVNKSIVYNISNNCSWRHIIV